MVEPSAPELIILRSARGQSLVELALVVPFIMLFAMGIIDAGFVFFAHTQVAAAAGEGALVGSRILVNPDSSHQTRPDNNEWRLQQVKAAVVAALGRLQNSSPFFSAASDVSIEYHDDTGPASRTGEQFTVTVRYRQPVIFGMLSGTGSFEVASQSRARVQ